MLVWFTAIAIGREERTIDAQKAWLNRQFKLEDSREQAHLSGLDEEDESEEAV